MTHYQKDIEAEIAERLGISVGQADDVLNVLFDIIEEKVKQGDKVQITNFASFRSQLSPARKGRNPRTGEPIDIAEKFHLRMKASAALERRLNIS